MGNWVYGCDVCQDVCPFNRFAAETIEHAFQPDYLDYAAPSIESILQTTEPEFKRIYANSPIKRIKHERWLRNGAVAAGNSGQPQLLQLLHQLLNHPSEMVKEHVQWAMGQVDQ